MKITVGIFIILTLLNIGFTYTNVIVVREIMQQASNDYVEMLKGYNDGIKEYMAKTYVAKQ